MADNIPPSAGLLDTHPAKERDVLPSVSTTVALRKSTAPCSQQAQAAHGRGTLDPERRAARQARIMAEITVMVREAFEGLPLFGDGALDLDGIELAVQAALRPVGGRLVEGAFLERVLDCEAIPPRCPNCRRRMEREQRKRKLEGLVGPSVLERGHYRCRNCHVNVIPADQEMGVGPGALSPALSRVVAMNVAQDPFGQAARMVNEALHTALTQAEVYRTGEALGAVAAADEAAQLAIPPTADGGAAETATVPPADTPAPPVPPGAPTTLLIGADGTTTHTDGDWHEVKVGVVAPLGPETKLHPQTGHQVLVSGSKDYCAVVGTADEFFPRLKVLVRQAGWDHPHLQTLLKVADGGRWIWTRMEQFDRPGVESVEVLDYIHASGHIWDLAGHLFGQGTLDAYIWAEPLALGLKEQGPAALLAALAAARPRSAAAKATLHTEREYFQTHAAAGRLDYPRFTAHGWPIASGTVEAACKSVVCQRTKGSGMRWRTRGAQAVLSLRCLFLSPDRWAAFFRTHPGLRRPPVATLRKTMTHAA